MKSTIAVYDEKGLLVLYGINYTCRKIVMSLDVMTNNKYYLYMMYEF